jgi:uncharacterized protein YegJ (DUF2314 family)
MEQILSLDLSSETSPVVQEVRGREYIEYGTEHWRNLYPQFLIDLYYNSSTHAAIINTTAEMIAGEDLIVDENENLEQFVKLKKFFAEANGKETLHEVIKKISFDFKLQGAFALHIIWNKAKTEIAEIHHVPVERVRAAKPNAMGKVDCYYVCADWSNTRTNKPMKLAAFNTKDRTNPSQLLYTGLYSPNMDIYHTPDYLAANNWALVDQRVAEFHLNNISNGFSGSYMISFANGVPTQEERFQIERSLAEKFTGASNSGKFVLTFSDDKTRTPEITPITVSNADKQYLALQELLVQNILTGHRVTSPMLMGIKNDTGLGSNVDEMNAAFEIYLNTVVIPFQKHIVKTLSKIFEINGINIPFSFVQAKPITSKFTIEDMKEVMTEDEIREELGLKPLSDEELTAEDEDNYNLEKDCDCGKNIDKCDKSCYEKTELDAFLETVEDIPEGWELIDEEVVDGEHADFNFEEELNQIASDKVELATTGVARPDSKSEQDGISKKTYDYYRVRYVYAQDNFLSRKSGKKRDFCEKMMAAKKLYRKEDIERMSTKRVNAGWGKGGADTYDIFLYKGGGNCHHFWLRQIYRTELGISVSTKIKDADLVGYTKARSEGFTAKRNDKRVAIAPKRMKNNGFVKKR